MIHHSFPEGRAPVMKMNLILLALLASGCDTEGDPMMTTAVEPEPAATSTAPSLTSGEVQTGTTFPIGANCQGGVVLANQEGCQVSVVINDSGNRPVIESRQRIKWGQLLAACGGLYRAVSHQSGGVAVFDKAPVGPPAGVRFRSDSLVVSLAGSGSVRIPPASARDFLVTLTAVGADGVATVELDTTGGKGREVLTLKAGDSFTAGAGKYRVLAVVPPREDKGIPGWIEIDARPAAL